ncbi:MAG: hybrid sensor histidine kinase/response regulator [Ramlibacter sp.]|nr:hybrid sensor histidine kinase/response regulator [Ramlibacter sp.]
MERRILIHAGTAQDAVLASRVLGAARIDCAICASIHALLAEMERGCGALLVAEEVISGSAMAPIKSFVGAQPPWSDLPVLVLTLRGSPSVEVQRAVESLGNVTLIERPVRTIGLVSAARSALRARDRQYQVRLADQRKDEFLATLAHELRNPLAPIRTSMSILRRLQPGDQVAQIVGVVDRQVAHLTRLVDDLLDVARISTGKVSLQARRTTVRSVLTHALEISSSSIQDKSHRLTVVQPEQDFALNADHARVVQSVANLLVNAAKFTPPNGEIELVAQVQGDTVQFRVKDNGRGLQEQSKAQIFELFAQAPVPGELASGLGIGLNLAKRFAEMHGGTITVASEGLDRGSEFVLSLPVVLADEGASPPEPAAAPPHGAAGARKILVVDDNVDAADTLEALLSIEGYSVAVAYDGQAALEAVRKDPPEIVLMDIGMPRMDGYEAARRIRAERSGVRLIALTGWGQDLDRQKAEAAGFNQHFVKPVDLERLLTSISS